LKSGEFLIPTGSFTNPLACSLATQIYTQEWGSFAMESLDKRGFGAGSEQEAWFLPLIAADAIF